MISRRELSILCSADGGFESGIGSPGSGISGRRHLPREDQSVVSYQSDENYRGVTVARRRSESRRGKSTDLLKPDSFETRD
jgi:hypothetical protein